MIKHVEDTVNRYVEELRTRHTGLVVELNDGQSPWVDARLRVRCLSDEEIINVIETVAHLTTRFYIDDGVFIDASVVSSGVTFPTEE